MFNDEIDNHLLSTLNFFELRELCGSNKRYQHLCSNNNLKYILKNKNKNIVIPSNIDIMKILNNIYNEASKTVNNNFKTLPPWVNSFLFKRNMIHIILVEFLEYISINYNHEDIIDDYLIVFCVHDPDVIMPLTALSDLEKENYANEFNRTELHIPKSFYHYILPTMHNIYIHNKNMGYDEMYYLFRNALKDLLFM